MAPILSLCIPTKGKPLWLKYNLQIALSQAQALEGQVEIVVSDNATADETADILAQFYAQYPHILRYERQNTPLSLCGNFLKTIQLSKGRFCWLIGNDDILRSGALAKVISVLTQHPELEYIHLNYISYNPAPTPEQTYALNEAGPNHPLNPDTQDYFLKRVIEVVPKDHNCFTAIYSSIFSRSHALKIYRAVPLANDFDSLESTVPHALYVIDHLLIKPSYYIGYPCLFASSSLSWSKHFPYYMLVQFPEIYRKLQAKGADPVAIETYLKTLRKFRIYSLFRLYQTRATTPGFKRFVQDNKGTPGFWLDIIKLSPFLILHILRTDAWLKPFVRTHCPKLFSACKNLLFR